LEQHDVQWRFTTELRCGNIIALAQVKCQATYNAHDPWRTGEGNGQHNIDYRGSNCGDDQNIENQHWERQHDIADTGQECIDPATFVACCQSQGNADDIGTTCGQRRIDQYRPRPVENT